MSQPWETYVASLRQLATAREAEQQRQARIATNRANATSSANANVKAAADRREQLERQVRDLEKYAAQTLADVQVSKLGPKATIKMAPIDTLETAKRAVTSLTRQLGDTADLLLKARKRRQEARDLRRNQLLTAVLLLAGFVLVKVVGGTWVDALVAVVLALLVLLVVRGQTMSYLSGLVVAGALLAVLVVLTAIGGSWWLSLIVAVVVIGAAALWSAKVGSRKGN
ncbi:hypothetical protein [Kribbella deserti]|uniref:Uncharacterized protein n=1 Tax=Kribbella deserti TaxID=1926257 RepID=A0ABV6QP30_9ACTN